MRKIMKYIYLLCLLFVVGCGNLRAQIFTQVIDEKELQFKVKQIDEFFRRFNYETDYEGNVIADLPDSLSTDSVLKRKNLMTLLNLDVFANDKNELDSVASAFLNYVIDNHLTIHYADTTWFAEAFLSTTYRGKSDPIRLYLKTEQVKDVIYKWVIADVLSPLLDVLTESVKDSLTIYPGAHGTSFMTVPNQINLNARSVRTLYPKGYQTSSLPVFEFLVSTEQIKLSSITKVNYHFRLDDNYSFVVEKIEKADSYNKGWLINRIEPLK